MRKASGSYNGHPSWAFWNVSLWISNDESLYRLAKSLEHLPLSEAAQSFIDAITSHMRCGHSACSQVYIDTGDIVCTKTGRVPVEMLMIPRTPDGARFTPTTVRHALAGLRE